MPDNAEKPMLSDQDRQAAEIQPDALGVLDTRSTRARKWSRVEKLTVRNFKAIKDVTIDTDNVTILVGPNGCGKSSVLQAVHWAARAASYIAPKNSKEMISFERLDYVPSSEPLRMAFQSELKSETSTPGVEVVFTHTPVSEEAAQATIRVRAARNKAGVTAYIDGGAAVTPYKQRVQFITAYIPGLAGLAEKESILAQPLLRRQAASGDAGGVLRNILLNLASGRISESDQLAGESRLSKLNDMVSRIHSNFSLKVTFDEREDYHISAVYDDGSLDGQPRSLETAATGVLQVVQIFAYLIVFEPKILLIDEPDAHLHPDKQERLIEALELAADEFETQIILSTHSPHIVRAASAGTNLVWMRSGEIVDSNDESIRRLLGWGGLSKSALFFVEDEDDRAVRSIMKQWPNMLQKISICRCFGVTNLPGDKLLQGLIGDANIDIALFIHRDRDFMTDSEVEKWKKQYKQDSVHCWVTKDCDIEAYFCTQAYLQSLYGVSEEKALEWIDRALGQISGARKRFLEKRKAYSAKLWPYGGGPDSEKLWADHGEKSQNTVVGKELHAALVKVVKDDGFNEKMIKNFTIPTGIELAEDLKDLIASVVK